MKTLQLMLFRTASAGGISLAEAAELLERIGRGEKGEEIRQQACTFAANLIDLAVREDLTGNLWQGFLSLALLRNENAFSLACEGRGMPDGSLAMLARCDLEQILPLFSRDLTPLRDLIGRDCLSALQDFVPAEEESEVSAVVYGLSANLCSAVHADAAVRILADCYRERGVGRFALHHAFRLTDAGTFAAVRSGGVRLSDLVGYEKQKSALRGNTLAFLEGRPANNVLLYGDAGTGKSTCVRALLAEYPDSLLRIIELERSQLSMLPDVMRQLGERHCRFLIFLDDLSFEEDETEYKQLKASIEGGLASIPENVLIYATSNRRHLIRENWQDRSDMEHNGDVHRSETMEEKLSLAGRFGLCIFFPDPTFDEYHNIVCELAARRGMSKPEMLRDAASAWQVRQGSRSGRTASQFIRAFIKPSDSRADRKEADV